MAHVEWQCAVDGEVTCFEEEVPAFSFSIFRSRYGSYDDEILTDEGKCFFVGGHPAPPARPASPLPPNVPTGPRNQNKYKDRDNNAQAVDGLDYGGGGGGGGFGGVDRGSVTPVDYDDRTGR